MHGGDSGGDTRTKVCLLSNLSSFWDSFLKPGTLIHSHNIPVILDFGSSSLQNGRLAAIFVKITFWPFQNLKSILLTSSYNSLHIISSWSNITYRMHFSVIHDELYNEWIIYNRRIMPHSVLHALFKLYYSWWETRIINVLHKFNQISICIKYNTCFS